jgi:mannose-1-phosphate guanylyltransferase / mannose-6-phosphate isomerase
MDTAIDLGKFRPQGSTQIHPVILSGGAGTRLWPLSRALYPKQFHALTSDRSLFQETVARNGVDAVFESPIIIANDQHRFMIEEQLDRIGVQPKAILLEPVARDTAPAIAAVALWLASLDPDAMMLVQPSDHVIGSIESFHRAVAHGLFAAEEGRLVTFGIAPNRPETDYGYIQVGTPLQNGDSVFGVDRFVEKPDAQEAQRFIESGAFYWNSGIFLFAARHFLAELRRLHPAIYEACSDAVEGSAPDHGFLRLAEDAFARAPNLSLDRAVMEHTDRAVVVPVEMAWSDVGAWPALREVGAPDASGNVLIGDVLLDDVRNCYIRSDETLVAALGLEDIVIVATDDAVLVARADAAADVSRIVAQLHRRNRAESLRHTTTYRPWGYYRAVDIGDRFQVKRLMVKPGAKLSLQKHFHRAEHWVVVNGTAMVQCGEDRMLLRENESIYIPCGTEHRLENPGKLPLHIIEVQSGAYLGEEDIVRIADSYGRS